MDPSLLKPLPHKGTCEASQRLPHHVGPKDSHPTDPTVWPTTALERNPVFQAPKNQARIDCASITLKLLRFWVMVPCPWGTAMPGGAGGWGTWRQRVPRAYPAVFI